MSHYNIRNVLTQSPEKIKMTVLAVAGVVAGVRGWDPSLLETVGVGIAIERVLDLIYVAPVKNANDEKKTLESIQLGKDLSVSEQPVIKFGTIQAPPVTYTPPVAYGTATDMPESDPLPATGSPAHLSRARLP